MRILYFSRDYTPHDHRFLSALAKTEHQVYFLRLEKGQHMLEDRPLPAGIEGVEWKGGKGSLSMLGQLQLLGDLRRVIQQVKPDLVQAGPIQRPALLTALSGFQHLVSMSWGYDLLHDAHINPFWKWATRYTLQHSASLVVDCDTIRQLAVSYGMPNERIITFPWGVDIRHFNVGIYERRNDGRFNLLSTRGFEPIYGVDVIAQAFVVAARQNPSLHLTLLGTGSQEAALRQVFRLGGVTGQVEFKGKIPYSELPAYYQQADMYLSASHSDGSSISLLEAFACGTPAIVSDIPGNCEWVTPGENGWLFPDGDATSLAAAILEAVDQPDALVGMGRKARLLAERRADWEKNFPMLEKAYSIALNQPSVIGEPAR